MQKILSNLPIYLKICWFSKCNASYLPKDQAKYIPKSTIAMKCHYKRFFSEPKYISRETNNFTLSTHYFDKILIWRFFYRVHQELRDVYRKSGWKETDFVTKTIAARNARPNSPTNLNSTLNRPMASQSGTRYEDRTMQRGGGAAGGGAIAAHMNNSAAAGGFMVSNKLIHPK